MSVRRHSPPDQEVDLEATAELPIIDFAAPPEDDTLVLTDNFVAPAFPAGVSELADSLREVESRLERKTERLKLLETQLATAEARERDQKAEQERERSAARQREADAARQFSETEQVLTALRADIAAREATFQSTRQRLESEHQSLQQQLAAERQSLQQQLDAERQSLTAARREVEVSASALKHQAADLADVRRRCERQVEALQNAQGLRGVREALIAERDAELQGIEARHAVELAASAARLQAIQQDLDTAVTGARSSAAALEAQRFLLEASVQKNLDLSTQIEARQVQIAQQEVELAALKATAEQARLGAAAYEEQKQKIEELQTELVTVRQQSERFEQDLRVAEEQIQRLESDAHASAAMLGNLQMNIARLGRDDTGNRPSLKVVGADLPARFLVRQEGGTEVPHPLARRTTIGRTPDNDIQIDTTFVSRHHAVILSGSQHCVVEDLNSTNGVMLNGRRVNRHILHDGDELTIGNTVFRFQQPA